MNAQAVIAQLAIELARAAMERDQAQESARVATLLNKEMEARVAELEPKTNGRVRKPVAS